MSQHQSTSKPKNKRKPIAHQLSDMFGGKWEYNRSEFKWTAKQHPGKYVVRVHTGGYDVNGEWLPGSRLFLYDNINRTSEPLYGIVSPGRPWKWSY